VSSRGLAKLALSCLQWLYPLWAAAWVLTSARSFYRSMLDQTGGEWSAPLDDVYIHFDYARSIAEGYPLQWLSGQGISTGNTSLTYPFVLAFGQLLGFRGDALLLFAAWLACMCVFGLMLVGRRLMRACFINQQRANAYAWVVPPIMLSLGVLNWSLWSGMEVAFFLAIWALAIAVSLHAQNTWTLGACCILLVATRPEALSVVAAFALFPARSASLWARARILLPPLVFLFMQAGFNRVTTGEWTQNGALVKLALYNPYYSVLDKLDDYAFNLSFSYFWNVEVHFGDLPLYGYAIVALALFALAAKETRSIAAMLLCSVVLWGLIVALNGQVRWQNQRYTTPAVAWLLLTASLGLVAMLRTRTRWHMVLGGLAVLTIVHGVGTALRPFGELPSIRVNSLTAIGIAACCALLLRWVWARRSIAVVLLAMHFLHQAPKLREQRWFFGRACRNIRDQQVTLGRWLGELNLGGDSHGHTEQAKPRVLVGDAGAILYQSQWSGLDMIGLGGLYGLPFARAYQQGLGASIELIERLQPEQRPQLLAIFPSWWEHLPLWFGKPALRSFPAEGNVICGDYAHVVYQADWHLLGTGETLRRLPDRTLEVRDAVDIGDLVSEREHGYTWDPRGHIGASVMRILPADGKDMWDGGREVKAGRSESFVLGNLLANSAASLVLRTIPDGDAHVRVFVDDVLVEKAQVFPVPDGEARFLELPIRIPSVQKSVRVRIENDGPQTFTDFHVYIAQ
jgi:hypothetical protein